MKSHLLFWAAVLGACFVMAGCQNMGQYSPEYRAEFDRAFWANYKGGGPAAHAWANYYGHDAAEKLTGEKAR